jgi:hypothetical protein
LFITLSEWIDCLYYYIKKTERLTPKEIRDQIIVPFLSSHTVQLWIMKQALNWYVYKNFVYSLPQNIKESWLKRKEMYTRYHEQAVKKYIISDLKGIIASYKQQIEYIDTKKKKENDQKEGTKDNLYPIVRNVEVKKRI